MHLLGWLDTDWILRLARLAWLRVTAMPLPASESTATGAAPATYWWPFISSRRSFPEVLICLFNEISEYNFMKNTGVRTTNTPIQLNWWSDGWLYLVMVDTSHESYQSIGCLQNLLTLFMTTLTTQSLHIQIFTCHMVDSVNDIGAGVYVGYMCKMNGVEYSLTRPDKPIKQR